MGSKKRWLLPDVIFQFVPQINHSPGGKFCHGAMARFPVGANPQIGVAVMQGERHKPVCVKRITIYSWLVQVVFICKDGNFANNNINKKGWTKSPSFI
jgi:hypothetical protein